MTSRQPPTRTQTQAETHELHTLRNRKSNACNTGASSLVDAAGFLKRSSPLWTHYDTVRHLGGGEQGQTRSGADRAGTGGDEEAGGRGAEGRRGGAGGRAGQSFDRDSVSSDEDLQLASLAITTEVCVCVFIICSMIADSVRCEARAYVLGVCV